MDKFKALDRLIEQAISDKFNVIVEREAPIAQAQEEKVKVLKLPKFALSEKWGDPSSEDRAILDRFFANIKGNTIQEKINEVQSFIKDCDENCISEAKVDNIIANLVFLDSLAGLIEDFNNQTGGFMFESLLAALIKGTQIESIGGRNTPIEDMIDSDGSTPLSIKFKLSDSKRLEGSTDRLRAGITKYNQPITYMVALKEKEDKTILGVNFYQFTVGDESQGHQGDFDVTQMEQGIKPSDYADKQIARLDFGSRQDLRTIADKYVSRLGQRIIDIFDSFSNLTNNLNIYFTDFENKTVAITASQDALKLADSVNKNIK